MSRSWFDNYENRRVGRYGRQLKERSETFVSNKYDFQGGNWAELNGVFIPSLNMTIGKAISALKKSWKMYKTNLSRGEPTDQYAKRLLMLQGALGLEQSEFLKEELIGMGYTLEEIEGGIGEGESETTDDFEWSDEDRQLLAEEVREAKENDVWGSEEESEDQKEWTDLDQRMFQEELDREREIPW